MHDAPDAREIVRALGGRWSGRHGMCRCPAHDDKTPSLSVSAQTTGFVLVHCFTGCPQAAVIGALRARGLWPDGGPAGPVYAPAPSSGSVDQDAINRRRAAQELWIKAKPARGSLVETYLKARGIRVPTPDALRFMPSLRHHTGSSWPCMLGAITDARGAVLAVQRTWLARDGRGKAPVEPAKMTLGPMDDGAVRLGTPLSSIGLAEGIETALSARQMYSLPVWAVLGGARFKAVTLPDTAETVHIFADRGDGGWRYANDAAAQFEQQGRHVEIILPPSRTAKDFNEELQARAGATA